MKNPIITRIVWFCVIAVLLYAVFVIWTDARSNLATLRSFPWQTLPLILCAVIMNFVLREIKWDYYRRQAGVEASRIGSFFIFFSGYSMAISPGRVGELIKPFMYKEYFGVKMRRSIPLVFCERLSDLMGMILLAAISMASYVSAVLQRHEAGSAAANAAYVIYGFLAFSILAMVLLVWLARHKRMMYGLLIYGGSFQRLRKPINKLRHLYGATYPLLTAKNLTITTLLAAISWSFECLAMMMILHGVGAPDVTLGPSTFIFCMATIVGGFLFFLPGGLGGFEGTTFQMLELLGLARNEIVPAILITRFSTLFFGVGLGFLFILLTSLRYHKSMRWDKFEHVGEERENGAS